MVDALNDKVDHGKPARRKGQFTPGQSGNRKGRPKNAKNLKTYLRDELGKKVTVIENGKSRAVTKAEAIAIQLVNLASKGDPKGLAAVIALVREHETVNADGAANALARPEDADVLAGIVARIQAAAPPGDDASGDPSPAG
jgi:hypothetical protein